MIPYTALFVLAVMGINETTYLIRKRIGGSAPVCPIGSECDKVLLSKHRNMLVIPLDVWGLLFYCTIALACSLAVVGMAPQTFWEPFITYVVMAGAIFSLFFTYVQWRIIGAWCFWCLTSAFTVWIMGIIIMLSRFN